MNKKRISRIEMETLLMDMFDIPETEYDSIDFEEFVNERFTDSGDNQMTFEHFELVLNALLPYAMASKSELTNSAYVGFAKHKHKFFLAKAEATEEEFNDIWG